MEYKDAIIELTLFVSDFCAHKQNMSQTFCVFAKSNVKHNNLDTTYKPDLLDI